MADTAGREKSLQEETTETFEDGAYEESNPEKEEMERNEEELTEIERENEDPAISETNTFGVVQDAAHNPGLREAGFSKKSGSTSLESEAFEEIYEIVGYDADMEGLATYPVELAGLINIEAQGDELKVSYRLERSIVGKTRDGSLELNQTEEYELKELLTPTDKVGVEVESGSDYLGVELFYDAEDLVEGSRETAEKLEDVEEYLSVLN